MMPSLASHALAFLLGVFSWTLVRWVDEWRAQRRQRALEAEDLRRRGLRAKRLRGSPMSVVCGGGRHE